jgi:ATP-dependent helicase/nuclease subunit B
MSLTTLCREIHCAPSQLVSTACARIVAAHAAALPDLTRITVLLPALQARHTVARELRRLAGCDVLLLPRLTTLRAWTEECTLDEPVLPVAAREALLYRALAQRRWFDHADLWTVVGELSGLFDELTRWHVGLPESAADFERRLNQAYRARAGASFAFEARLVHELWHALAESKGRIDAEAAYQLKLSRLLSSVNAPVYAIGLGHFAPAERQFLAGCATRVESVVFGVEACEPAALSLPEQAVAQAWSASPDESLHARAQRLRAMSARPVLAERLRFFGAHGVEQEARAIDHSIRRWLSAGKEAIGVVVFDRVTARRARALLERAQILVRDEAGWAFSTTSAATVLNRWFDVCSSDFYHRDLLDLLKSPFAFGDWPREARQEAVWRLEHRLRRESVSTGLDNYLELAASAKDHELRRLLLRVQRGAALLDRGRPKTLARWLSVVEASIGHIGVAAAYAQDAAGVQLLELLRRLRDELAQDTLALDFAELRRWLAGQLEAATFQDAGIVSPVVFTSLSATRLRRFDAVLVIGADATHLPGADASGLFFNQSVRRELGLPGRQQQMRDIEQSLSGLIANAPEILVTWQHTREGEPNLLAPVFERLRSLHRLAWNDALDDTELACALDFDRATRPLAGSLTRMPSPQAPPACVPGTISASAYNALMACPYQFFARHVLKLREHDEVQEELDKAGYGSCIHDVLHQFHQTYPRLLDVSPAAAEAALDALSQQAFRDSIAADYLASAWLARWQALIPRYVEWQREREAEGWLFSTGELDRTIAVATPAGRTLQLRGRIDRIDTRPSDDATAVIDYKTQARRVLEEKVAAPGEDVQLPVYALLWGGPVAAALFLSLDQKQVQPVGLAMEVQELAHEVQDRIARLYDALSEGASLPAQGIDSVCEHCEMAGLCRRKHWA